MERAADLLRTGELVGMPTETVYGLAANALDAAAVASIFTAKERPSWDPLIVHISSVEMLHRVTRQVSPRALRLMEAFWPGPLTLLLPRHEALPTAVSAGRDLVGVRMPQHPVALRLIQTADLPLAAPSANRFGHISPTTAQHVLDDLDGRVAAVLDAGACAIGLESTVLDPETEPMVIYRPGAISAEALAAAAGVPVVRHSAAESEAPPQSLPSPGVGMRHYAPRARLSLAGATNDDLQRLADENGGDRSAVLLPRPWQLQGFTGTVAPWGDWADAASLSRELYRCLRTADAAGVETILCPLPEERGDLAAALRDRLQKAARRR